MFSDVFPCLLESMTELFIEEQKPCKSEKYQDQVCFWESTFSRNLCYLIVNYPSSDVKSDSGT